ncbi:MAG: hypothetical protein C7B45_16740 [Sulfobacillus acidophilus]|uniref:Uncharacterized protein n=1 Tax=Sulfobacillus acidophilus TaxID=53633 RepID=A0A2T2WCU5_9FIRM|nr:MAG: hypothetical protein C7B45_16740 [Sulfobacillus acidophilus]
MLDMALNQQLPLELVDSVGFSEIVPDMLYSRNPDNPWVGCSLRGRIHATYLRGQVVSQEGRIVDEGQGHFIRLGAR